MVAPVGGAIAPEYRAGYRNLYQRAKMLTHHALDLLKCRTGLTKGR